MPGDKTVSDYWNEANDLSRGGIPGMAGRAAGILPDRDVEAEETEGGTVAPVIGSGEAQAKQSGTSVRQMEDAPTDPNPKAAPKSLYAADGTIRPPESDVDQQRRAEAQKGVELQRRGTAIAQLQGIGVADQELSDFANIDEMMADEGARLHSTHFAKAQKRTNELHSMIDSARTMRVDPFNWGKSIGRGGRVAAAFSLLTGQMAAGAGNPNSALKMMDAAIERDMSAQKQNIANEQRLIQQKAGANVAERALYGEELSSLNTIRAMKYASILSRIDAAKMHATNESAYLSYKHMGDHYTLKLLDAKAAAQAEILSVHVKGPIQVAKVAAIKREIAAIQGQLSNTQAETAQRASARIGAGAPTTPGAEPSAPAAPGRAGAVAARRGPKAQTGGTPPSAVEAGTSAPAPVAQQGPAEEAAIPASSWVRQGFDLEKERTARGAAEDVAARKNQMIADEEQLAKGPARSFRHLGHQAAVTGTLDRGAWQRLAKEAGMNDYTIKNGGFGRGRIAEKNGYIYAATRVDDAIEDIANDRPIDNDGMADPQDARIVSDALPPPRRSQFETDADYQDAMEWFNYASKKYEVFEAPFGQNTIDAGGRMYRVKATSTWRNDTPKAIEDYSTAATKLQDAHTFIKHMRDTAKNIRRVGLGTGGWFNSDEGAFSIPGLNSYDPGSKELTNTTLRLAMGFIKTEDPTARLSDKDVEIGEKAMALLANGKIKMLDLLQSFDGRFDDNTIRRSMDRYMQKLATNAQKAIVQQYQNDLILDYNSQRLFQEESSATQQWLKTTPEWDNRKIK